MGKGRKRLLRAGPKMPRQVTLRLSASGTAMLLGDLEHALMETVWAFDRPANTREIHARIVKARGIALITVVTVLNRLVKSKHLLRREKIDDLFHFSPTVSRQEFMQRSSRHVVERVLALGSEAVTASIVDVLAERDPELLAELGRLVRQRIRDDAKGK